MYSIYKNNYIKYISILLILTLVLSSCGKSSNDTVKREGVPVNKVIKEKTDSRKPTARSGATATNAATNTAAATPPTNTTIATTIGNTEKSGSKGHEKKTGGIIDRIWRHPKTSTAATVGVVGAAGYVVKEYRDECSFEKKISETDTDVLKDDLTNMEDQRQTLEREGSYNPQDQFISRLKKKLKNLKNTWKKKKIDRRIQKIVDMLFRKRGVPEKEIIILFNGITGGGSNIIIPTSLAFSSINVGTNLQIDDNRTLREMSFTQTYDNCNDQSDVIEQTPEYFSFRTSLNEEEEHNKRVEEGWKQEEGRWRQEEEDWRQEEEKRREQEEEEIKKKEEEWRTRLRALTSQPPPKKEEVKERKKLFKLKEEINKLKEKERRRQEEAEEERNRACKKHNTKYDKADEKFNKEMSKVKEKCDQKWKREQKKNKTKEDLKKEKSKIDRDYEKGMNRAYENRKKEKNKADKDYKKDINIIKAEAEAREIAFFSFF